MKINKAWIANTLWQISSWPAWLKFQRASKQLRRTQHDKLFEYIHQNADTAYGRRYSFSKIKSISEYQKEVPLTTYDDYIEDIDKIGRGELNVLTKSPVRMLELSSGSTAASKLIPYTNQLHAEFQSGISPWIFNLFQNYPGLKKGSAYWSISPLTDGEKHTPAGIPIGFEEDSEYLGRFGKILVDSILAVPNQVKHLREIENFQYITLLFLLGDPTLKIISIWNPTFLNLLLAPLPGWWDQLIQDIKNGSITPPKPKNNTTHHLLTASLKPNPSRAKQLSPIEPNDYVRIWPKLELISCWADGPAASHAEDLKALFPGVIFQGKGLIATEAFLSFPVADESGAALAIHSHFYEFLPVDRNSFQVNKDKPQLAHELEIEKRYSVVITTGGGFYRYLLQDIIEVVGFYHEIPLIRFIGKTDRISDWFGEKLNEGFVSSVLESLFEENSLTPIFSMLAPNSDEEFRYTLYLELPKDQPHEFNQIELAQALDQKLQQNFHYSYCRKLGQISQADLYIISQQGKQAYLTARQNQGQKLGNIKNTRLETTSHWTKVFRLFGNSGMSIK